MRNRLQYVYSISVLIGVLVTAYFMMDRDGIARLPHRYLPGEYRSEGMMVDPALVELFEMEKELRRHGREKMDELQRFPTENNDPPDEND